MGVKNESHENSPRTAVDSPSGSGDGLQAEDTCRYAIESEVIFLHRQEAGESFVVAKHMARATYFRLGAEEYQVARLLNGNRSARDVVVASRNLGLEWSIVDVAGFIGSLVANGLAHVPESRSDDLMTSLAMSVSVLDEPVPGKVVPRRADSESAVFDASSNTLQSAPNEPGRVEFLRGRPTPLPNHDASDIGAAADASGDSAESENLSATKTLPEKMSGLPPVSKTSNNTANGKPTTDSWYRPLIAMLSILVCQRLTLGDGDGIAKSANERFGSLFSRTGCWNWSLLVGSGLLIVLMNHHEFSSELAALFDPTLWVILLAMWVVAKLCHELGHAIAARHHGIRVGKFGLLFFFLAPLPFVDVTDAWKLESKWKRIQIGLGGVYIELALAAIAAWVWWLSPSELVAHLAAQFFLIAGPGTLLVNANPLLRLDGYYVLSDLTGIPNLRMHGRKQLGSLLNQYLMGTEAQPSLLKGWRRPFATVHAFASVAFQVVWMSGLIVAVSHWMRGLGMVIAIAAISLWVILPLLIWVRKMWYHESTDRWQWNTQRMRLLTLGSFVPFVVHFMTTDASPLMRRVPVVVQNHDPQIARATADALVVNVYVQPGQRVLPGMLLLELENPELVMQRSDVADELAIAEVRAVQWRGRGELSKAAAEFENAESLRRQIMELDEQIDGLKIVAERAGYVLNPDLAELKGCFVDQGDELCQVMDPGQKELLASVGESDLLAYRKAAIIGVPVAVRLKGGTSFSVTPTPLQPRARLRLPHPTLAATSGGPLPVEFAANDPSDLQARQPQLQGVIQMNQRNSSLSRDGQIGMMTISDNRSMFERLVTRLTR